MKLLVSIYFLYFWITTLSNCQLFDILNKNVKEKAAPAKGIDDLSVIFKKNDNSQALPRFSQQEKDDFINRLLNQAKSLISQKKEATPEPLTKSLNKYLPPDFQNLPGLAKRIRNIVEENNRKNEKKYENISLAKLIADESDSKNIEAKTVKVKSSLSFPSKKFKMKVGNETIDVAQISKALLFNVRVMKKCGKHLEKCTISTSPIEKELIKAKTKTKTSDQPIRFVEVSNDEDLDEYSSIESQLDKIESQETNETSDSGNGNPDVPQNEIEEALDF